MTTHQPQSSTWHNRLVHATLHPFPERPPGLVESSGGVRLALHHIGGKGPTMLICHATGFHALAYTPLARSLVDHFTVWAVDFRGHGASTAPPTGEFPWATMADDVLACVDAIGDDAIFGVGHSMGGAALLLAERTRPGTVRAAYLFEPIVVPADFTRSGQPDDLVRAARGRRREFDSRRAALERYRNRPPLAVVRIDALAAYVEHGFVEADNQVRLACEPESEARTFAAEDKPTHALLNGIDSELTVAYGTLDDSGSPAQFASGIAEILPKTVLRPSPAAEPFRAA